MKLTTSDKICIGMAIVITLTGLSIKQRSDRNYATANAISKNVRCSHQRLSQIGTEVQNANRALLAGNSMMRQLLTNIVK